MASALKRAATVDLANRDELLKEALDGYRKADATTNQGRFGSENAVQLAVIVGGEYADSVKSHLDHDDAAETHSDDSQGTTHRRVDQCRTQAGDFWSRTDLGDRALTRLIAAVDEESRTAATDRLLTSYERAFASRSTWSERQTVIDHLRDLLDLIPDPDARRPHLQRALVDLQQWEVANVEQGVATAVAVASAPTTAGASPRSQAVASGVSVTAFPAGCGDSLLVEWDGATGTPSNADRRWDGKRSR